MKYQQRSFSVGYTNTTQPTTVCPRCTMVLPREVKIIWKLCKRHKSEFPSGSTED